VNIYNGGLLIHTDSKTVQNGLTNEKYEPTSAKYLTTKLVQLYQEMHENLSIAINLIQSLDNLSDITTKEVTHRVLNLFLSQTYCDMSLAVEDLPFNDAHISLPAPPRKRMPLSSRSIIESKRLNSQPQDDSRVSYDSKATRFPSNKVSSE